MLDLVEVFEILRHHKICLNAAKCVFGVGSRKFLNYMITCKGIKVNPNQISVIQQLNPPRNPKEVQKLIRMIKALNQFVSKSADRCCLFFQLLGKCKGFQWTKECDNAFQSLTAVPSLPTNFVQSRAW